MKQDDFVPYIADMDTPLLQLSSNRQDRFTLRDATAGVQITGGTGSGKTSGSGAALAETFLKSGFGFLIMTAKPGEYEWIEKLAKKTGRECSVIRFSADSGLRFNFLDYIIKADEAAGRGFVVSNLVSIIMRILEAAQRGSELRGQAAEQPFWRLAPREMLEYALMILYAAYGTIRLADLIQFILSIPRTEEDFSNPSFQERSFHLQTISKMVYDPVHPLSDADADAAMNYFRLNFGRLDERTRSNIVVTMTSQLSPLLKGVLRDIFCTDTNIVPELTFTAGAIIVLDFPVKSYGDAGLLAQHIFKFLWQRSVESRDVNVYDRPVVLWGDEAQFFITPYDIQFQTTARSSRACTVYLTQSISNYFASIGGSNPRDATHAFLNNFMTRIAHSNMDHNTNQAFADMIGRDIQLRRSAGQTHGGGSSVTHGENTGLSFSSGYSSTRSQTGEVSSGYSSTVGGSEGTSVSDALSHSWSSNHNASETMDYIIQPGDFAKLPSGPEHGWRTDAIWFQTGRGFKASRGRNFLHLSFPILRL